MQHIQVLTCPFCLEALELESRTLICPNGHTFDIDKEGYLNLLRKRLPGDTKEMLQARRAFLEHGFYQPLSDAINTLVAERIPSLQAISLLDAGCGEGYYLGCLQQALSEQTNRCVGLDISKEAIRMAAKRYPNIDFVVANLKEPLPLQDNTFQLILNIFAPRNAPASSSLMAGCSLQFLSLSICKPYEKNCTFCTLKRKKSSTSSDNSPLPFLLSRGSRCVTPSTYKAKRLYRLL